MPDAPAVSVIMAVREANAHLHEAVASINAQSLRCHELIVVHTADSPVRSIPVATGTDLVELHAPGANLAAAMNLALRRARHPLAARMDDDDVSLPGRLESQARYLASHPGVAVLGTGFDRIDGAGGLIETCQPPRDPREVRWRLLVENCVTHGSVMMRRDAVLAAGGYDESLDRAQDYDLWLRMAASGPVIANLPDRLYQYRCDAASRSDRGWRNGPEQARAAAGALLRAWSLLPQGDDTPALHDAVTGVLADAPPGADPAGALEALLTAHGPTRSGLQAWLWARALRTPYPATALREGRRALLRQAGERMAQLGAQRVWLWGAGKHTERLLQDAAYLAVPVAGVVDDLRQSALACGFTVQSPGSLRPGEHVLLSSDLHEDAMWRSSAPHRARGVLVHRLYTSPQPPALPALREVAA